MALERAAEISTVVTREAIAAAEAAIRPYVRRTPVAEADGSDFGQPAFPLTLKLEQLQRSGSFKARGAIANLRLRAIPSAGVVAASGGNHGAAVAYAAGRLGVPARIFVPTTSSPAKVRRIREQGADLVLVGERYADALAAAEAWVAESGAASIHAFDQVETLLGAGTLALEMEQQAPRLDTLLLAVGGGGLIGATGAWYRGALRLVGVEPVGAPTLTAALRAGRPVDAPTDTFAADSLAPRRAGELTLPMAQAWVDRVVLVDDDALRRAQEALWDVLRVVAEPGAAAPMAALLAGAYRPAAGERVGVVVCGGNTTAVDFTAAAAKGSRADV